MKVEKRTSKSTDMANWILLTCHTTLTQSCITTDGYSQLMEGSPQLSQEDDLGYNLEDSYEEPWRKTTYTRLMLCMGVNLTCFEFSRFSLGVKLKPSSFSATGHFYWLNKLTLCQSKTNKTNLIALHCDFPRSAPAESIFESLKLEQFSNDCRK